MIINLNEIDRDYLIEALDIAKNITLLLPEREHIRVLYSVLKAQEKIIAKRDARIAGLLDIVNIVQGREKG
jgi:hypothetical protein